MSALQLLVLWPLLCVLAGIGGALALVSGIATLAAIPLIWDALCAVCNKLSRRVQGL